MYLFVVQHEDLMQSTNCPVIPEEGTFSVNEIILAQLATQISPSKLQKLVIRMPFGSSSKDKMSKKESCA